MWKPNIPAYHGLDLAEGYETLSTDPDEYSGHNVLILGEQDNLHVVVNIVAFTVLIIVLLV